MPCTDDYREQIKSSIADIMNTGGSRYGGAIAGAMFLKEFAGDTPWIHLDIAGTAWVDEQKPWQSKGPSGIGVRSITEWVRSYVEVDSPRTEASTALTRVLSFHTLRRKTFNLSAM